MSFSSLDAGDDRLAVAARCPEISLRSTFRLPGESDDGSGIAPAGSVKDRWI
jgi:hypothetical protein